MKRLRTPRSRRLPRRIGPPAKRALPAPRRARGHLSSMATARIRAGLTVRGLAARVGITPASMSRIERGLQTASSRTVGRIRRVLGIGATKRSAES